MSISINRSKNWRFRGGFSRILTLFLEQIIVAVKSRTKGHYKPSAMIWSSHETNNKEILQVKAHESE